jgi:hypothetical protein
MQIAIGFGRETRVNAAIVLAAAQIFRNNVTDEMRWRSLPQVGVAIVPCYVPIHNRSLLKEDTNTSKLFS